MDDSDHAFRECRYGFVNSALREDEKGKPE